MITHDMKHEVVKLLKHSITQNPQLKGDLHNSLLALAEEVMPILEKTIHNPIERSLVHLAIQHFLPELLDEALK